jgi:predicted DNA-binding transcriptional regulator YafY
LTEGVTETANHWGGHAVIPLGSPTFAVRKPGSTVGGNEMKSTLRRAMTDSDRYVIEMDYADADGRRTHRVVSPIRFVGDYRFLGLCLCREAPRQFHLSRCENVRLVPASDILMPVPIGEGERTRAISA